MAKHSEKQNRDPVTIHTQIAELERLYELVKSNSAVGSYYAERLQELYDIRDGKTANKTFEQIIKDVQARKKYEADDK